MRVCKQCGFVSDQYGSKEQVIGCPQCNQMKFELVGANKLDIGTETKVVDIEKLKEMVNTKGFQPKDYKEDEMVVFVKDLKEFVDDEAVVVNL